MNISNILISANCTTKHVLNAQWIIVMCDDIRIKCDEDDKSDKKFVCDLVFYFDA